MHGAVPRLFVDAPDRIASTLLPSDANAARAGDRRLLGFVMGVPGVRGASSGLPVAAGRRTRKRPRRAGVVYSRPHVVPMLAVVFAARHLLGVRRGDGSGEEIAVVPVAPAFPVLPRHRPDLRTGFAGFEAQRVTVCRPNAPTGGRAVA